MRQLPFLAMLILCLGLLDTRADDEMREAVFHAISMLNAKQNSPEPIPRLVLHRSTALGMIEVTKGAFGVGGTDGQGIIVVKTDKGWSAPIAFHQGGGSVGFQFGVDIKRYIYIFNTDEAWQSFTTDDSTGFQAGLAATAGPTNVNADGANGLPRNGLYVYSLSDGAFVGASLGGQNICNAKETNQKTYGTWDPYQIINPRIAPPAYSRGLYDLLNLVAR